MGEAVGCRAVGARVRVRARARARVGVGVGVRVRVRVRLRLRLRAHQLEHDQPVADLAAVLQQERVGQFEHVALWWRCSQGRGCGVGSFEGECNGKVGVGAGRLGELG